MMVVHLLCRISLTIMILRRQMIGWQLSWNGSSAAIQRILKPYIVLSIIQMNRPRFKSPVASGFSEHKKPKQEVDTLYQSPVSFLEL